MEEKTTEINFATIEKKWQDKWESEKTFEVKEDSKKPKYYCLEMFPYPSGEGLHMGHSFNFILVDILARFKKLHGFNVLHPLGYDSLGLPAENAAIKAKNHPKEYIEKSIPNFKKQQKALGLSYDWSRILSTADPSYYKWDQWIFLKMFEKNLAYQKTRAVNWCPNCKTVLANEQAQTGNCDRCETKVIIKHLKQWFLKITDYADELYEETGNLDWPEKTKAMQRNWIGKSHGTEINFKINGKTWPIFTTRPDTIYGVTFMVVSAQHEKLNELVTEEQKDKVDIFLKELGSVSEKDMETMDKLGVFTGSYAINPINNEKVPVYAGNFVVADYGAGMVMAVPAHDQRDFEFAKKYHIPIKQVVAPSFLDEKNPPKKDAENTERNIIHAIVLNKEGNKFIALKHKKQPWLTPVTGGIEKGESIIEAAKREIKEETGYQNFSLERKMPYQMHAVFHAAHKKVNRSVISDFLIFKLNNEEQKPLAKEENELHEVMWLPISKLHTITPVSELPEMLKWFNSDCCTYTNPGILINSKEFNGIKSIEAKEEITKYLIEKNIGKKVTNFKLRDWGISRQRYWGTPIPIVHCPKCGAVPIPESDLPIKLPEEVTFREGNPLETNEEWINTKCPKCSGKAKRETDTMDTFTNSSWYFFRFCDPNNDKEIFNPKNVNYWCPIDAYIGGAEHACMHLIYSRFYTKFLNDLGLLDFREPIKKLYHQGMINDEKGQKQSKSKGNVIEPLGIIEKYGSDILRYFIVSVAAPDKGFNWSEKGITGSSKLIKKIIEYFENFEENKDSEKLKIKLNKTIKNLTKYYDQFEYRKATIELRELFDLIISEKNTSKETLEKSLKLLNPICPHITEELWEKLGNNKFISTSEWPKAEDIKESSKNSIDLTEKIITRINQLLEKTKNKEKIFIYTMPFEIEKIDKEKIKKETKKEIEIYATSNKDKYDPENKSKKAKPGMASIYLE